MADRTIPVPESLVHAAALYSTNETVAEELLAMIARQEDDKSISTSESVAYNIVNQIADVYHEAIPSEKWVEVRQSTNDRLWKWTEQMISGQQPVERPMCAAALNTGSHTYECVEDEGHEGKHMAANGIWWLR